MQTPFDRFFQLAGVFSKHQFHKLGFTDGSGDIMSTADKAHVHHTHKPFDRSRQVTGFFSDRKLTLSPNALNAMNGNEFRLKRKTHARQFFVTALPLLGTTWLPCPTNPLKKARFSIGMSLTHWKLKGLCCTNSVTLLRKLPTLKRPEPTAQQSWLLFVPPVQHMSKHINQLFQQLSRELRASKPNGNNKQAAELRTSPAVRRSPYTAITKLQADFI